MDSARFDRSSKKVPANCYKEMLKKFKLGTTKSVYSIVTGDKTWIDSYELGIKQQSSV